MIKNYFFVICLILPSLLGYSQNEKNEITQLYNELATPDSKPDYKVFEYALLGYLKLERDSSLGNKNLLTIIDFSLSANKKRLWVIDIKNKVVIHHTLVAHGKKTGEEFAKKFSNIKESHMSSLGFYVTQNTYFGKHGLSLILEGVEDGFNNNAKERAIVIHGAKYVSRDFIKNYGRLGRSFGCPALSLEKAKVIIPKLSGKTCLFIYFPDENYLKKSKLINEIN